MTQIFSSHDINWWTLILSFRFHWLDIDQNKILDVNGSQNCLVTNILQKILFYVTPKKEIQTDLEWYEAE